MGRIRDSTERNRTERQANRDKFYDLRVMEDSIRRDRGLPALAPAKDQAAYDEARRRLDYKFAQHLAQEQDRPDPKVEHRDEVEAVVRDVVKEHSGESVH